MALNVLGADGTLFDVHAMAERNKDAIAPKWQQLSRKQRAKQSA
jgi:hypothetical protein